MTHEGSKKSPSRRPRRKKSAQHDKLIEKLNVNAAGIDVGSARHFVAVPPDRCKDNVREFGSFTHELERIVEWLDECDVTTVAMESTGVYWVALYELLEDHGFDVVLVNARSVKNVPGRKTDVLDCQWLQELHTYGLLRASFRPTPDIVALRSYVRHRESLVQHAAQHLQRMQKSFSLMNIQLHNVVSDIGGKTGMKIIRAIVDGERNPRALAEHRDGRCKATPQEVEQSLQGSYRPEHLFSLKHALEAYDVCREMIAETDRTIDQTLERVRACCATPRPGPIDRSSKVLSGNKHELRIDVRERLFHVTGADLTQIEGIGSYAALRLIAEIGYDMSRWPSKKHFTSWASLCPANKVSGGRLLSTRTRSSANRVAVLLRMCAMAIGRRQCALGAFYRRLSGRIGKAKAVTATARKLAERVYLLLKNNGSYRPEDAEAYEADYASRKLKNLRKQARRFGYTLTTDGATT
jgi:transposase